MIIDLPCKQLDALARLCKELNISRAEAIRRAVGQMINENSCKRADVGFGIWRHKKTDSRKQVENARTEWR
jgi:hypothetical protein